MGDFLSSLNDRQREAVTFVDGFIRVVAGAGAGKTKTLSSRFAYLVENIGIMPSSIMCVTFTNKAAGEMKSRIRRIIGDSDTGYVNTFHGFCVTFLKEEGHLINYPQSFTVLDGADKSEILKKIYDEQGYTLRQCSHRDALDYVEICKAVTNHDYYLDLVSFELDSLYEKYQSETNVKDKIFRGYVYYQKKLLALDFDDLIYLTLYILKTHPDVCLKWQKRLEYIMVDEFQDIDRYQYELTRILCNYHKNLFIVGDPDQTIYTWRGACISFINNFDKEFEEAKTVVLDTNYRSTPEILKASNSLIEKNKNRIEKRLCAVKSSGAPVVYNHAKTEEEEAFYIVSKIKELLDSGVSHSDIAVLYRAHFLSRSVEEALIKANIPYTLYSGVQFYERQEIKDILSYLKFIAYRDDLSFRRIVNEPKRNIGKAKMELLQTYAIKNSCSLYDALKATCEEKEFSKSKARSFVRVLDELIHSYADMSLSDLLSAVLDRTGYEEYLRTQGEQTRLDNLAEFKASVHQFETSFGEDLPLEEYLSRIALFTNSDLADNASTVKLMTIHTAKGLEFKYVFVSGLSEGLFPSRKISSKDELEEERRLAYVAMTRAQDGLYLSDSEGKTFDGRYRYPSRFIFNIEKELLLYETELDEQMIIDAKYEIDKSERELNAEETAVEIGVGDTVVHEHFGRGIVVDKDEKRKCWLIKFESLPTERNIGFMVKLDSMHNA